MMLKTTLEKLFPKSRVTSLLGDSAWQFGEMGIRMLLNLVVGALVARHLSTTGFGILSYVAAIVTFVFPLVKLGLDAVIVREISVSPEQSGPILKAATRITTLSGIVGALGILVFAYFGGHERDISVALAVGSIACLANPLGMYYGVLKANFYSGKIARFRIVLAFVFAAVRLAFVFGGAGPMAFVACVVAEEMISNLICYILCKRYSLLSGSHEDGDWKHRVKPLLVAGFPLMLSFVLIGIYSRLDVVMLEHMKGIRETGIYSAGFKISELWNCIPGIFVGTFLPHFAKLRVSEPEIFLRTIRRFAAGFFWGSLCIVVFTILASSLLVKILFGPDYLEAVPVLRIHVLCFPGVCLGGLLGYWYILEDKSSLLAFASAIGLLINAIINYFLIPHYGASGAAAATAISYSLSVCAPLVCFPTTRKMAITVFQGIILQIR
ncbi:MAG: flippase [Gloeobacteraceae cyanobacterium ES-bin-144]|nr:flippase [Verrucomicrobiales bacterium]